jgi:hypothetical protein
MTRFLPMVRLLRLGAAAAFVALLSACASGPKMAEVQADIRPLAADKGRIYFYRSGNPFAAAIQPTIMLNGAAVGDSKPGGIFFVDRAPGPVEVSMSTEVEKKLSFTLDRGETRYVRSAVGLGVVVWRVYPELVDNVTGAKETADLSYTGASLGKR